MVQFFKQFGTAANAWEATCIHFYNVLPLYDMSLCIIETIYNSIDCRPAVMSRMRHFIPTLRMLYDENH